MIISQDLVECFKDRKNSLLITSNMHNPTQNS